MMMLMLARRVEEARAVFASRRIGEPVGEVRGTRGGREGMEVCTPCASAVAVILSVG